MLSASAHAIVSATAPVVAEHAVAITRCFYPRMFAAHPELLRVFNQADQHGGEQAQTLAASIVAYATSLVSADGIDFAPILRRIAHKHVSLGIVPEQYGIVGEHLMAAIGEVLGDAVTPDVALAWHEVYWLFAVQLVALEAQLYAEAHVSPEQPWRVMRVVERREEAIDLVTFVLEPTDGRPVAPHIPGQYVSIVADLPNNVRQPRQYTISSAPEERSLTISVKRVRERDGQPAGVMSTWLHENAMVGTEVEVSPPCGDVVLSAEPSPLLLVSAGAGLTPMAAIVQWLAREQQERPVTWCHGDVSPAHHGLRQVTDAAVAGLPHAVTHTWYESGAEAQAHTGWVDLSTVEVAPDVDVFMCGPLPFMRDVRTHLLSRGVQPSRVHYEVFGPDLWIGQRSTPAVTAA